MVLIDLKESVLFMKKQLISICVLLFIVSAQLFSNPEIGITSSISSNTLVTDSDYYDERSTSNLLGCSIVIPFQYPINNNFGVRAEISVKTKNYTEDTYQTLDNSITSEEYYNSYIELPLILHFTVGESKKIRPVINLGGYFSYWLTSYTKGKYLNLSVLSNVDKISNYYTIIDSNEFNLNNNRFNWGLLGGIGLEYHIEKDIKAFFETRISYDISSIYSTDQTYAIKEHNMNIEWNFGVIHVL